MLGSKLKLFITVLASTRQITPELESQLQQELQKELKKAYNQGRKQGRQDTLEKGGKCQLPIGIV